MKKLIGLAIAISSAGFAMSANASGELDLRPYAGLEYQLSTNLGAKVNKEINTNLFKDNSNSIAVVAGLQITEFVGVEASLSHNLVNTSRVDGTNAKVSTASLSITTQYPLTDYVYAKGSVGAIVGRADLKTPMGATFVNSDVGFLGKFGLGYIIDDLNVLELSYTYGMGADGVGLLYKHYFN